MQWTQCAQVVDLAEASLRRTIRLDHVAAKVGYSAFHLHREFRRVFGLPIHDYVRRRRMTEAARRLTSTDEPISDIALAHGYSSQQSFSDAFVSLYGTPPGAFRRNHQFYPILLPYWFDADRHQDAPTSERRFARAEASASSLRSLQDLSEAAVDLLPRYRATEHAQALGRLASAGRLFVATSAGRLDAALSMDEQGHIGCWVVHPLARSTPVGGDLLGYALRTTPPKTSVTTSSFRDGNRADLWHRPTLRRLGFVPERPVVELGYPAQLFRLGGPRLAALTCAAA